MKTVVVIVVIAVALVVVGGISQSMKNKSPDAERKQAVSDCELPLDVRPSMLPAMASSPKEEVKSKLASMIGCTVPASGWTGQVTAVNGQTVRFETGTGITAFTVVLLMKEPHKIQPGDSIRYRGRLDGAMSKIVMANVINRVDLSEGELVK